MQPLQDLLNRIRWDPDFGRGTFAIGYLDRIARTERIVPFESITIDPQRRTMLTVSHEDGTRYAIPLHRVRTVYKDGSVIWQRPE